MEKMEKMKDARTPKDGKETKALDEILLQSEVHASDSWEDDFRDFCRERGIKPSPEAEAEFEAYMDDLEDEAMMEGNL